MRILLWHGYLLTGSGSNVYTANVARAWRAAGHDVLLLCQERDEAALGWVDEEGDLSPDNSSFSLNPTSAPRAAGRCRLARPAIGEILPLYVFDEYPGFTAKLYVELTDGELTDYTQRNVAALVTALEEHRPDAVITGHEVMGPYIAKLACEQTGNRYIAKLHGSALEYAVKRQERYLHFARAGLTAAGVVVGGSNYMVRMASSVVPGWEDRAAVVNPGCDVALFRPPDRASNGSPVAGFVGKLIAAKGVHNFVAALGLTRSPGLTAVMVGYGDAEADLRALHGAIVAGDRRETQRIARGMDGAGRTSLVEFLARQASAYWARAAAVPVAWPGRLDHGPLAEVLPSLDVLVAPSVVPEAFGMVAAEAAACGVLPIVPRHSGIGEAGAAVESAIGRPGLLTFDPAHPIGGIAKAIDRVLALAPDERRRLGHAAAELARLRWSWDRVAGRLLELATQAARRTRP
ncbi:hypothetical protein BH18ACT15_BH18ACT15_15470 [soil metagenome]